MIIATQRSRTGYWLDWLMTCAGWLTFIYLIGAGLSTMWDSLAHTSLVSVWTSFLPTLRTLTSYVQLALCNALVLYAWAFYNYLRFAGASRRQSVAVMNDQQLAHSFSVQPQQVAQLRVARVSEIHHDAYGEIQAIEELVPNVVLVSDAGPKRVAA